MDKIFEKKHHRLEVFHWWTVSRRRIIMKLIEKAGLAKDDDILEIGCSIGLLLEQLKKEGYKNLYGIDISEDAVKTAREDGLENIQVMDASQLIFDKKFGLLIASDVLEHLEDDRQALRNWLSVMKPGGRLIVFLPAHKWLWSQHDEINHHYRRYSRKYLNDILEEAGFIVERSSYWNLLLFFAKLGMVFVDKFYFRKKNEKRDQFIEINPLLNRLLIWFLGIENSYAVKNYLPFGVSVFAIAKKE